MACHAKKYIVLLFMLHGCSGSRAPSNISGHVIDANTKKPVPGAFVMLRWNKLIGIVDQKKECSHVAVAMTNANGDYHINAFEGSLGEEAIAIYKEGYEYTEASNALKPFSGGRDDRINGIYWGLRYYMYCNSGDNGLIVDVLDHAYSEIKAMPVPEYTADEKMDMESGVKISLAGVAWLIDDQKEWISKNSPGH